MRREIYNETLKICTYLIFCIFFCVDFFKNKYCATTLSCDFRYLCVYNVE